MKNEVPSARRARRREFFRLSSAALAVAGLAPIIGADTPSPGVRREKIKHGDVILFQGDSVTDALRDRKQAAAANNSTALGAGYAWQAGAELLVDRPNDGLKVFNRGLSGDKVFQLANRWDADCLALKPNLLSILVGVNDYWHIAKHGYAGSVEVYERDYRALLERTFKALPKVKLIIGEPFVLRCGVVEQSWFPAFDAYRAAACRVAQAYSAAFIPYQSIFDEAAKLAQATEWLKDGVHPTALGAALMAYNWMKVVNG